MTIKQPRPEYPRPQFARDDWLNLNGVWEFDFDDSRTGLQEKWYHDHSFSRRIVVPYCYQSARSGIEETDFHDVVWYRKQFVLPDYDAGKRLLLHFGAVDYWATVWVNGEFATQHEGGHTPFAADITDLLQAGENVIVVRAEDDSRDVTIPRGKQYWKEESEGIFYTRTTGIWQTVWLEPISETHIEYVNFTPNLDQNEIKIQAAVQGWENKANVRLNVAITFDGQLVTNDTIQINHHVEIRSISLHDSEHWWSPENPHLYDVSLELVVDDETADEVNSYFGMRKISVESGQICLNNRPYFMKLVLDQGYFPDGLLTAPTDEDLRRDVELTKQMGFNGARKHQKVEDPRYLYWCDRLGLLVWGEMANAYHYSVAYVRRMMHEWQAVIGRDYNHPCIVAWVPLNESWGVPNILVDEAQQQHALAMYHLTKSIDDTRLVISNDGWEHVKSDICTIHDYEWRKDVMEDRYRTAETAMNAQPAKRWIWVPGYESKEAPIIVSEFGGISFKKSDWDGWGYSSASDEADYIQRLADVFHPLLRSNAVQGYCFTQLTDVEQEINGLLTYDRRPKVPVDTIYDINQGRHPQP